jgi:hypothetical protein
MFGLTMTNEAGDWWIAANLMRDAAALRNIELLPWDRWGAMPGPEDTISSELARLFDRLAALTENPDASHAELDRLCQDDERLRVPPAVRNTTRNRDFSARNSRRTETDPARALQFLALPDPGLPAPPTSPNGPPQRGTQVTTETEVAPLTSTAWAAWRTPTSAVSRRKPASPAIPGLKVNDRIGTANRKVPLRARNHADRHAGPFAAAGTGPAPHRG